MTVDNKPKNYWTYETLKEEALKYDNKKDFRKYASTAASYISQNNWNELTAHMKKLSTLRERYIYAFEFQDNHVYVGLTCDISKRYGEHISENRSQVSKHIHKTQQPFEFKIITQEPISMKIAGEMETQTLQQYTNNGWIILNKAKTGSLGGIRPIWTYDKCKQEALKYNCPIQLRKNLKHVITIMKENGWFEELTSHIVDNRRLNHWNTYENCKQEALKYKTLNEFRKKCNGAYKGIVRNGWKKELISHLTKQIVTSNVTYEQCKAITLKCTSCEEIKRKYWIYYKGMINNGWYEELTKHIKLKLDENIWTYEKCEQVALAYKTATSFKLNQKPLISYLKQKKWYEDIINVIGIKDIKPNGYWTYERCKEVAMKCNTYTELSRKHPRVYTLIKQNNWNELEKHIPKRVQKIPYYWTYDKCKLVAKECTGRWDLKKKYKGAYELSLKNKWLDEFYPKT